MATSITKGLGRGNDSLKEASGGRGCGRPPTRTSRRSRFTTPEGHDGASSGGAAGAACLRLAISRTRDRTLQPSLGAAAEPRTPRGLAISPLTASASGFRDGRQGPATLTERAAMGTP